MSSKLRISYIEGDGLYPGKIKTTHDGYAGGVEIKAVNISSISNQHYYENIKLEVEEVAGHTIVANDLFHPEGWSLKLLESYDLPEEESWNSVLSANELDLSPIGTSTAGNTDDVRTVWIRLFCPGHTDPNILNSKLKLKYTTKLVVNAGA